MSGGYVDTALMAAQAKEFLDLTPDGWERSIYFDVSKLFEEGGELAEALNKTSRSIEDAEDEFADAICCLFVIALKKGFNPEVAILRKHEKRIKKVLKRFHGGVYPEKVSG